MVALSVRENDLTSKVDGPNFLCKNDANMTKENSRTESFEIAGGAIRAEGATSAGGTTTATGAAAGSHFGQSGNDTGKRPTITIENDSSSSSTQIEGTDGAKPVRSATSLFPLVGETVLLSIVLAVYLVKEERILWCTSYLLLIGFFVELNLLFAKCKTERKRCSIRSATTPVAVARVSNEIKEKKESSKTVKESGATDEPSSGENAATQMRRRPHGQSTDEDPDAENGTTPEGKSAAYQRISRASKRQSNDEDEVGAYSCELAADSDNDGEPKSVLEDVVALFFLTDDEGGSFLSRVERNPGPSKSSGFVIGITLLPLLFSTFPTEEFSRRMTIQISYLLAVLCSLVSIVTVFLYGVFQHIYSRLQWGDSDLQSSKDADTSPVSPTSRNRTLQKSARKRFGIVILITLALFAVLLFCVSSYIEILRTPLLSSIHVCVGVPIVFLISMYVLLVVLPKSFTLGEAIVVSELNVLQWYLFYLVIVEQSIKLSKLRTVILLGLAGASWITAHIIIWHYFLCKKRRGNRFFCTERLSTPLWISITFLGFTLLSVGLLLAVMSYWIRENSLLWVVRYVTQRSAVPLKFVCYYVAVLGIGLLVGLPIVSKFFKKIIVRKYFHFLALFMFVPSILLHIRFTSLAFAVGFAIILVVEACRSSGVEPIASLVTKFIAPYLDERDTGRMVLTHMHLLLGCAIPVWYAFFVHGGIFNADSLLIALSGMTVTCIGDSFASIFGSAYGRFKWPGRNKTIEGSVAFFVSLFVFQVLMLYTLGFHNLSVGSWFRLFLADLAVCLLEASTDQIDNLILPLFHCAVLQLV